MEVRFCVKDIPAGLQDSCGLNSLKNECISVNLPRLWYFVVGDLGDFIGGLGIVIENEALCELTQKFDDSDDIDSGDNAFLPYCPHYNECPTCFFNDIAKMDNAHLFPFNWMECCEMPFFFKYHHS